MRHALLNFAYEDQRILARILMIHNAGKTVQLDPSFSKGVMYKGLPEPPLKLDIEPQRDDVQTGCITQIPFESGSIDSIAFDLPYLIKTGEGSLIKDRFGRFDSWEQCQQIYRDGIAECARVLKRKGLLVFKVQPSVSGGKQKWLDDWCIEWVLDNKLSIIDKAYSVNETPMQQPGDRKQRHLKKAVNTWFICRKH